MKHPDDLSWAYLVLAILISIPAYAMISGIGPLTKIFIVLIALIAVLGTVLLWFSFFSESAVEKAKRIETYKEIPENLKSDSLGSVVLGKEMDLLCPIYLPEKIRSRHVHILGSTGSGKTESVVLNLLRQDIALGRGAIILDAKGDDSFKRHLNSWLPPERLAILDLGDENSTPFNPIKNGSPIEAAQRLHSSLTWSEEYYKSKALTALLRLFEDFSKKHERNPTLSELNRQLYNCTSFIAAITCDSQEKEVLTKSYDELSGLSDQIKALSLEKMGILLSPKEDAMQIDLTEVLKGKVFYFRLQNLMSPQTVAPVGKLVIANINYMAGTEHRSGNIIERDIIPVFLDEFAAFASPMFTTLISMARSAKYALHFSHQSIGDLMNIDKGFVSQITDNSGTKIILRVNDPDTADYFAKTFGTKEIQKITQKLAKTDKTEEGELVGEGSARDAHKFRAAPDLLKTLPTGMAACLIAHGEETKEGASHVFKLKFPRLEENK